MTSLGFLHSKKIKKMIASDINESSLVIAQKNLLLLKVEGLKKRIKALKRLYFNYNKLSRSITIKSSLQLLNIIKSRRNLIEVSCFKTDITEGNQYQFIADIIIADFPYGQLNNWQGNHIEASSLFFNNIIKYMRPNQSVLATIANKSQKLITPKLKRIEHFKARKRQIAIFLLK